MPRPAAIRPQPTRPVPGELALIDSIRQKAARTQSSSKALRIGIGDDCAILRPTAGYEICITTDFSLENVHFRRDLHPPQSVGHRCLARGLSDLAAMGADPLAVFLSLALPARTSAAWVDGFMEGLLALAAQHHVPLAGGDTAQSPQLITADIVAVGQLPRNAARLRSGAQPGDFLYVTGALGGSAAELLAFTHNPRKFRNLTTATRNHPHLYPQPRLAAGRRVRKLATAVIDTSDGLSTDLTHLCQASKLAAEIEEATLPIHPLAIHAKEAGLAPSALDLALHGGEDYELLFTAPPTTRIPRTLADTPIHRIGTMSKPRQNQPQIVMKDRNGQRIPIQPAGWEHFSK
ncbi:MAG: thiamine-phosphate kinase [Acidobacteriaceae bacterium]